MTTYCITIDERTDFGKDLISHLSTIPEIKFVKMTKEAQSTECDKMVERMKKAARNAKELASSNPKTYSAKELMEVL